MDQPPIRAHERPHDKYQRLIAAAQRLPAVTVAVVHPCDDVSLQGAIEAQKLGLIAPILVGPPARIHSVADGLGIDISALPLVASAHSHDSAAKAVALVRAGKAQALMKGSLHTDEVMAAVVAHDTGIRTERRLSHCFVMDVPGHTDPLIITDAAVNIAPTLEDKVDIVQNAIDLAHAIGLRGCPRGDPVGDGDGEPEGALDDRGGGAVQDGRSRPDHRRDAGRSAGARQRHRLNAAAIKHIVSPVAGRANVLVVPDLVAGNMLAKSLTLPGGGRQRGDRAGRAGADHPDQPGGYAGGAAGVLRGGLPGRGGPARRGLTRAASMTTIAGTLSS